MIANWEKIKLQVNENLKIIGKIENLNSQQRGNLWIDKLINSYKAPITRKCVHIAL